MGRSPILSLTGARFFPALWIVFYHFSGTITAGAPWWFSNFIRTGYISVTFFFVLSGFILSYNYAESGLHLRSFWTARFARVYPVFLLGWLSFAPLMVLDVCQRFSLWNVREIGTSGLMSLTLLQAWHPRYVMNWNPIGWAVSAEIFFYFVFPFAIRVIWNWRGIHLITGICVLWLLSLLFPLVNGFYPTDGFQHITAIGQPEGRWVYFVKFNPLLHLPSFLSGVLMGKVFLLPRGATSPKKSRSDGMVWFGLAVMLLFCCFLSEWIYYPIMHNGLLAPVFGVMIFGLAWRGGAPSRFLSRPLLVKLGASSYPVIMMHVPVALLMEKLGKPVTAIHDILSPRLNFIFYVIGLLALSLFICRFFEEPMRKKIYKWLGPRNRSEGK